MPSAARGAEASPPIITLVHGTFGRRPRGDAKWTREGSAMRRTLATEFGDVAFSTFRWSGLNGPAARRRAARRLAEHFATVASANPGRRHFVVAHSHGGNVALHALRIAGTASGVSGLACLSTPFIVAQPNPATTYRLLSTYAVILVALFALVANLLSPILQPVLARVDPDDVYLAALAYSEIWLEFAACAVLAWFATRGLVHLAERREREITVREASTPIVIFRSMGDEASAVLATSAFLSWLVVTAWRVVGGITLFAAALGAFMLLLPLLVPVAAAAGVERLVTRQGPVRRAVLHMAGSLRVAATLTAIGVLACYALWGYFLYDTSFATAEHTYGWFVAALFAAVLSLNLLSGTGYGLTAPFLEVTAESTPVGSWPVHLFAARTASQARPQAQRDPMSRERRTLLAHSAAYHDPAVLDSLGAWMRSPNGLPRSRSSSPNRPGATDEVHAPDRLSTPITG